MKKKGFPTQHFEDYFIEFIRQYLIREHLGDNSPFANNEWDNNIQAALPLLEKDDFSENLTAEEKADRERLISFQQRMSNHIGGKQLGRETIENNYKQKAQAEEIYLNSLMPKFLDLLGKAEYESELDEIKRLRGENNRLRKKVNKPKAKTVPLSEYQKVLAKYEVSHEKYMQKYEQLSETFRDNELTDINAFDEKLRDEVSSYFTRNLKRDKITRTADILSVLTVASIMFIAILLALGTLLFVGHLYWF